MIFEGPPNSSISIIRPEKIYKIAVGINNKKIFIKMIFAVITWNIDVTPTGRIIFSVLVHDTN